MKFFVFGIALLSSGLSHAKVCNANLDFQDNPKRLIVVFADYDKIAMIDNYTQSIIPFKLGEKSCEESFKENSFALGEFAYKDENGEDGLAIAWLKKASSGQKFTNLPILTETFSSELSSEAARASIMDDLLTECISGKLNAEYYVREALKATIISSKGCDISVEEDVGGMMGGYSTSPKAQTSYEIIFR